MSDEENAYVSQAQLLAAMGGLGDAKVSQAQLLAAQSGDAVPGVVQLQLLVAQQPEATEAVRTTQFQLLAALSGGYAVPAVTWGGLLYAYRTGVDADLTSRAWTFSLDGHTFYVITLGEQGTFVYDLTTGQWAKWKTQGLNTWNMERGLVWRNQIIAADRQNPVIWKLDPDSFIDDDYKAQIRAVTGGAAVRQREFVPNYAFRITASMGDPDVPPDAVPAVTPTIQLSYSDDQGNTYVDAEELTLETGDFEQALQWLSLGQVKAPGRVFVITDTGAIARLDGADAEVGEDKDDG